MPSNSDSILPSAFKAAVADAKALSVASFAGPWNSDLDALSELARYLRIPEQVAHRFRDDAAHLFRLIVARHSD
jgi:hypothetical protein